MKDIAIYGAGGFGREVACLIHIINKKTPQWNLIGFFDDNAKLKGTKNEYGEVLGGIEELNNYNQPLAVAIAIGSPKTVAKIVSNIHNKNIEFPNIISPDIVYLDENNISIGIGNIIGMRSSISCNVTIGNFNIFNGAISVGHDTSIGNYNSFMTNTIIAGEVKIGDFNYFGAGSVVLQQITIGNDTVVGANSLILRNTKDGMTYIGSPAKIMKY